MRDTVSFGKLQLPPDVAFGVVDEQVGKGQYAYSRGRSRSETMTVRAVPGWSEFADGILGLGFASLVSSFARQNLRVGRCMSCGHSLSCPPHLELRSHLHHAACRPPVRGREGQSVLVGARLMTRWG